MSTNSRICKIALAALLVILSSFYVTGDVNTQDTTTTASEQVFIQHLNHPISIAFSTTSSIIQDSINIYKNKNTTSTDNLDIINLPIRAISQTVLAKEQSEGKGARVRRTIGRPELQDRFLDPFLLMDEFRVGLPGGFPDHPHRGFGTITYVLPTSKGSFLHEDFTGTKGFLHAGDVQIMYAGKGIVHAEMPASTTPVHGIQLWLNSPKKQKMDKPSYQELTSKQLPQEIVECASANIILGEAFKTRSTVKTWVPANYIHYQLQPNCIISHKVSNRWNNMVYNLSGTFEVVESNKDGQLQGRVISESTVVTFKAKAKAGSSGNDDDDDSYSQVLIKTGDTPASFIYLAGEPINEPVKQYGPFVMNVDNDIRQAFYDYQNGGNGFENAGIWKSEIQHLSGRDEL